MRLGEFKSFLQTAALGVVTLSLTGLNFACDGAGSEDRLGKSFINPGEMMRLTHDLIRRPIQDKLQGVDEPNEEFALARNVVGEDLKVDPNDYVISKNDLIQVQMTDVVPGVETTKTTRVTESGNITLPLIGQVQAVGVTERQLEMNVQEAYRKAGIVKEAQISAQVVEARGKTFQIRGAVARPGQYAIVQNDFRVIDALILAGDPVIPTIQNLYVIRKAPSTQPTTQPTAPAGDKSTVPTDNGGLLEPKPKIEKGLIPAEKSDSASPLLDAKDKDAVKPLTDDKAAPVFVNGENIARKPEDAATTPAEKPVAEKPVADKAADKGFEFNSVLPEDNSTIIRVPLKQLINGDLKYNIVIHPQDVIVVPTPESGEYYMGGHVQREGVYSLTARDITLKQAVIGAGGLDEIAIPERTDIIRRIGRDREVFVRVNLVKIFEGKQPDLFLKPYDIVYVGTNAAAPFIAAVRNAFRITYGFGFLYDRNFYNAPGTTGTNGRTTTR